VRRGAALVLSAAALAAAAGCGGSTVTEAVTTDRPPGTTASPVPSAPTAPAAPTAPSGDLEGRLPPEDALAGLRTGRIQELPSPQALVDALYRAGDPSRDAAERRLAQAGYEAGVLRDQSGEDPSAGPAMLRAYVMRLRDVAAARAEVDDAVDEVRATSTAPARDVDVPGVPDARGIRVDISQGEVRGGVVFVTFPAGPYVQGLQVVARSEAALPEDELVAAARDLYARAGAAP
jgi:hypothetical protein